MCSEQIDVNMNLVYSHVMYMANLDTLKRSLDIEPKGLGKDKTLKFVK